MTNSIGLQAMLREVSLAIRRPEELVQRWRDAEVRPLRQLIAVLLVNAIFGTATYGLTMQMHKGALAMLGSGFWATAAAGLAWVIALPSLYIVNTALGSQLGLRSSLLVASVTVCFGAWAMLASVPINWFFSVAVRDGDVRLLVNLVVYSGVGVCMTDVFMRCLRTLDPHGPRLLGYLWITLLAIIGAELFVLFGVFSF